MYEVCDPCSFAWSEVGSVNCIVNSAVAIFSVPATGSRLTLCCESAVDSVGDRIGGLERKLG
jgi:hypothetical protein